MKYRLPATLLLLAICLAFCTVGSATTETYVIPEFNGGPYADPGPFPSYTVATITITGGSYQDVNLSGTFGNSVVDQSGGVDLFFGNITSGFYLVGQCFEFDVCWTGPGPTPWSADLGALVLPAGDYYFIASQTAQYNVRLGQTDINFVTPEPSSLLFLGTGLAGAVGVIRRKFLS